jgi:rhamnogalacturonan endolyase
MPTLMHDHTYRMGICWQNSAYNQPPHLGYYLPDAMLPQLVGSKELTVSTDEAIDWLVLPRYTKSSSVANSSLPSGLKKTINYTTRAVTFTGAISTPGDYEIPVSLTGLNGEKVTDHVVLHVKSATGISTSPSATQAEEAVYDLQGRRLEGTKRGLNIVRKNGQTRKVLF